MSPAEQYAHLQHGLGATQASRALIRLTGEDRVEWLQGQATNDVTRLSEGRVSFCLCSATGQLEAVVDAWSLDDHILLSTDLECAPAVMRRIEQMVIMEDVQGEDLTTGLTAFRVIGTRTPHVPDAQLLLHSGQIVEAWMTSGEPPYPLISADTYDVWRLERGIPSWGIDMGLRTLPPEMGPAFESRYVSYTKGCYMGQEVLQRIHSRGHTNWTWAGLLSDVAIPVGATVDHASRARAGTVTSSGYSPALGNIAAVRLRNEAATPGDTVFIGEGQARVVEMPLIR